MVFDLFLALSIRFFFFDFVLFKKIREYLKQKGYFFEKLLGCPFCQGFWCGLFIYLISHTFSFSITFLISWVSFGFVSAYLSLAAAVALQPLIERYEKYSGIPLE